MKNIGDCFFLCATNFIYFCAKLLALSFFRRNINGILGTILFHLIVICVCLACKIGVIQKEPESYIIIDPQDFEMEDKQSSEADEEMMTDEQIDQYLQNLGITGSNYSGTRTYQQSAGQSMSEADMKARYEEQFLREKYGDDYPVFTCEGSGVVVVRISVASSGKVASAEVVSSNLTADVECLTNAARTAALKSAFSKISGNKTEGGKITYTFVKQ